MLFDQRAKEICDANVSMLVPWYLMAAYAYYVEDDAILSDSLFDEMAKTMLDNWEDISHWHKEYISIDDLEAGTFLGEYPSRVKDAVNHLRLSSTQTTKTKKQNSSKKSKPKLNNTMGAFGDPQDLFDWGD